VYDHGNRTHHTGGVVSKMKRQSKRERAAGAARTDEGFDDDDDDDDDDDGDGDDRRRHRARAFRCRPIAARASDDTYRRIGRMSERVNRMGKQY